MRPFPLHGQRPAPAVTDGFAKPIECLIEIQRTGFDEDETGGCAGKECQPAIDHDALSTMASRAAARGPLGRPWLSRQSARRMASGSAPCWTAKLNAIAASRAAVSAPLFVLWFEMKTSPSRPSL